MLQASEAHALRMDAIYGAQRHIYDATRKYYLLGRDRLLGNLRPGHGHTVLEIGCGTGRNLAAAGKAYPTARLYGLDISAAMLTSASAQLERAGLANRCRLARADAVGFHPETLFGISHFDRIFLSYTLSMIPDWRGAVAAGLDVLAPGGELHIVDFGDQADLPDWFGRMLAAWLRKFEVTPRTDLFHQCETLARDRGMLCTSTRLFGGYAWSVVIR